MQMIDELHKLDRDLQGLSGLLYNMSDAADKGACIDEAELMLLAEIAGRGSEVLKKIIEEEETNGRDNS